MSSLVRTVFRSRGDGASGAGSEALDPGARGEASVAVSTASRQMTPPNSTQKTPVQHVSRAHRRRHLPWRECGSTPADRRVCSSDGAAPGTP
eukprot:scaffold6818_cov103-Isochrysis_galbana.AAC.6